MCRIKNQNKYPKWTFVDVLIVNGEVAEIRFYQHDDSDDYTSLEGPDDFGMMNVTLWKKDVFP